MPIARPDLEPIARAYVADMTSIRGRRVHRLLMREFSAFDHVLPARTEAGAPALLALTQEGRAAVCCTDGRGAAADVVHARLDIAAVATSHDLLKDSLPVVRWTIRHPAISATLGAIIVAAADVPPSELERIADVLRGA